MVLESELGHSFNSVMCCYYKNGIIVISFCCFIAFGIHFNHQSGAYYTEFSPDDDEFLGPAPGIAMVALGRYPNLISFW